MKPEFKPVFEVYKEGVTTRGKITILKKDGEDFNEKEKRNKFLSLGYVITEIKL